MIEKLREAVRRVRLTLMAVTFLALLIPVLLLTLVLPERWIEWLSDRIDTFMTFVFGEVYQDDFLR